MKLIPIVVATFGLAFLAGGFHIQILQGRNKEVHSWVIFGQESHGCKYGHQSSGGRKLAFARKGYGRDGHSTSNGRWTALGLQVARGGDIGHGLTGTFSDTRESHG